MFFFSLVFARRAFITATTTTANVMFGLAVLGVGCVQCIWICNACNMQHAYAYDRGMEEEREAKNWNRKEMCTEWVSLRTNVWMWSEVRDVGLIKWKKQKLQIVRLHRECRRQHEMHSNQNQRTSSAGNDRWADDFPWHRKDSCLLLLLLLVLPLFFLISLFIVVVAVGFVPFAQTESLNSLCLAFYIFNLCAPATIISWPLSKHENYVQWECYRNHVSCTLHRHIRHPDTDTGTPRQWRRPTQQRKRKNNERKTIPTPSPRRTRSTFCRRKFHRVFLQLQYIFSAFPFWASRKCIGWYCCSPNSWHETIAMHIRKKEPNVNQVFGTHARTSKG